MMSVTKMLMAVLVIGAMVLVGSSCQENSNTNSEETIQKRSQALTPSKVSKKQPSERKTIAYPKDDGSWIPYEPNTVLVKFKKGITAGRVDASLAGALGLSRVESRSVIGIDRMKILTEETVMQTVTRIKKDPRVVFAEPNWKIRLLATPNDPRFDECWGLHNTGQSGGTVDADIDAVEAWDISTGSADVIVAVLDTGVDYTHPDLEANMWTNPGEIPNDNIDNDNNGYIDDVRGWDFEFNHNDPMDDYGHGTHCAGTIGAVGDDGYGVAGVNWTVTLMPLRIIGNQDLEGYCLDAAESIHYAVDNGAHIMSCSWWTVQHYSQTLEEAVQYAEEQGVMLVAAAGNDDMNDDSDSYQHWPSEWPYENIIAVAATNRYDEKAYFSCYGPETVDVGAPGEDILSTVWPSPGYDTYSGTSMATPHTAGAAALVMATRPDLDIFDVRQVLFHTVDPIADLQGITVTGGRINAHRALQAVTGVPLPPVAMAGGNRTVMTSLVVELDGSKSFDPNIEPITYQWELLPPDNSNAVLSDPIAEKPTFLADVCGVYQVNLVVQDEGGLTSEVDQATINVVNMSAQDPVIVTDDPYPDNADFEWIVTQRQAEVIGVHFNRFDTESNYDFVRIYDSKDQEWAVYHGPLGEFDSVAVPDNTLKIRFTSDGSMTRSGFEIDTFWWCGAGNCELGTGDCDDNPDDCEVDTFQDIGNCGWCDRQCLIPNATPVCNSGVCEYTECDAGWTDCDENVANGCEADLLVDANNCQFCGNVCGPYAHGTPGCLDGVCLIAECDLGWDDCTGGLADGCEQDVSNDLNNCGGCDNVCALPNTNDHVCINSDCYPKGPCSDEAIDIQSAHEYENNFDYTWEIVRPGMAELSVHFSQFDTERNYDFVYIYDGSGVEYAVYDGDLGAFQSVLVPGDTIRIRLDTDGSQTRFGFVIDSITTCTSGCATNWGNCDGDSANGCESPVASDVNNCGACGAVCGAPNTTSQCADGVCTIFEDCNDGFGNCDADISNGCEADFSSDPNHCNDCVTTCSYPNAIPICNSGVCEMGECLPGFGDCANGDTDGCEISTDADIDNCGGCGVQCNLDNVGSNVCEDGQCIVSMAGCSTEAVSISCPNPYPDYYDQSWQVSRPGASRIKIHFSRFDIEDNYDYLHLYDRDFQLVATYTGRDLGAFDSDWVDGDTINVRMLTDGSVVESGFEISSYEYCEYDCSPGWGNCDGIHQTGCEANLSSDNDNCSACGSACEYGECIESECFCEPECTGLICGSDSCGGSCGECDPGLTCVAGDCVCIPDCNFKDCGDDGCGGSCGQCADNFDCIGGTCICEPKCTDKECGDDTCGGICGICDAGEMCNPRNQCVCDPMCDGQECGPDACGGICGVCPENHICNQDLICECIPSCDDRECGDDGCGGTCGECGPGLACGPEGQCVCAPDCNGKECGSDGCGGTCGTCSGQTVCSQSGQCECAPDCDGKDCGDDGCGGSCGDCVAGEHCNGLFECVCEPDCTVRECGLDPRCGETCGSCQDGYECSDKGQCKLPEDETGCGCGTQAGSPSSLIYLLVLLGLVALRQRRPTSR
jgi:MYXO-CTERM domain-containing protein